MPAADEEGPEAERLCLQHTFRTLLLEFALKCMPAADEEGPEAKRLCLQHTFRTLLLEFALKCMPAADEEGPEAERLRLYDVQWLDEPSLAQARIGEEALNPTYL